MAPKSGPGITPDGVKIGKFFRQLFKNIKNLKMAYFKVLAKNTDPKTFFALKTVGKKFIVFSDQPLEKTGTFYPIFQKNISPSKKFFKAHLALLNDRVGLEEQFCVGKKKFSTIFWVPKNFFSSIYHIPGFTKPSRD